MIRSNNDCVDYNRFSGSEIVLQHFCHVVAVVVVVAVFVVDDVADSQKQNEMRRFQQKN